MRHLLRNPVVLGVLFFVQGLPLIACNATVRSLQQQMIPNDLLGRVGAVNRLAYSAITPLGLAAGRFIATWVGYPAVWIIAGCGFLAAFGFNLPAIRSGTLGGAHIRDHANIFHQPGRHPCN